MMMTREVHSWCVHLDAPAPTAARLYATLTPDERSRSARFRFERDRSRFVVAHGALRVLLGRTLGVEPGRLRFVSGAFGKPELDAEFGGRLRFNLSHSGDVALIAIAADADVGVDVEQVRAHRDYADVARAFLPPVEARRLEHLPSRLRARAFLGGWTKREAYAKARGAGLDFGGADTEPAGRWSLFTFQPAAEYVAALVVQGTGWRLRRRDCPLLVADDLAANE